MYKYYIYNQNFNDLHICISICLDNLLNNGDRKTHPIHEKIKLVSL